MSDTAAPIRYAPIALWRVAQAFLGTLYGLFGAPEDVARDHTLTAKAHKQMAQWLRCAEALLRRLLAIEASAYSKPNTRLAAPKRCEGGPLRVRRTLTFTPDAPQDWRVSFRLFSSSPAGSGGSAKRSEGASRPLRRLRLLLPRKRGR